MSLISTIFRTTGIHQSPPPARAFQQQANNHENKVQRSGGCHCSPFSLARIGQLRASFCAVNSNWTAEIALAESANAYELRYEYINQDQPMFGSRKVSAGEVPAHHDEFSTRNRNLVASYSHNFGNRFGVTG